MKQTDGHALILITSMIMGCSFGILIAHTLLSEVAMEKVFSAVRWGMNNPFQIIYYCIPPILLVVLRAWYKNLYKSRW